jgi:hypothetical protein
MIFSFGDPVIQGLKNSHAWDHSVQNKITDPQKLTYRPTAKFAVYFKLPFPVSLKSAHIDSPFGQQTVHCPEKTVDVPNFVDLLKINYRLKVIEIYILHIRFFEGRKNYVFLIPPDIEILLNEFKNFHR